MQPSFALQPVQGRPEQGQHPGLPLAPSQPLVTAQGAPNSQPGGFDNPGNTAVEFWKIANGQGGEFQSTGATGISQMSQVVEVQGHSPTARYVVVISLVAFLAVIAYSAYSIVIRDQNPVDALMALVSGDQAPAAVTKPATVKPIVVEKLAAKTHAKASSPVSSNTVPDNPYWNLPNTPPQAIPQARAWTAQEEDQWRRGLGHQFTWQRFKTVKDVREARLQGSEAILWEALEQPKFWTRMSAAIGLAEMGLPIAIDSVEKAIGPSRDDRVANYFERYVRHPSPAELYVMKQAVRLVPAKSRITILRAIRHSSDPERNLYLTAASMDPSRTVAAWWKRLQSDYSIAPAEMERHRKTILAATGQVVAEEIPTKAPKVTAKEAAATAKEINSEEPAPVVETVTTPDNAESGNVVETEEVRLYEEGNTAVEAESVTPPKETTEPADHVKVH